MIVVYLFLFIVSLIVIKTAYQTFFVPATIMAVCWCIFPSLATAGVLGIYDLSWKTHAYIIFSYLTFMLITLLIRNKSDRKGVEAAAEIVNQNCAIRYKLLMLGNIVIAIWLSTKLGDALAIIADYGFVGLRNVYENILSDTVTNIMYNWFAKPFVSASCAIFCVDVLHGIKKEQQFVGIAILTNIALDTVVFAARATIVKMVIYIFFAFFFCKSRTFTKKQTFLVILLTIALMTLVVFMTGERMSVGRYAQFSLLDSIYMYYAAPFGLLNTYVENPGFAMLGGDNLLFGAGTFGAIYNVFRSMLYVLFGLEYNGSDYIIQLVTQETIMVGANVSINSACTSVYVFLRDFGVAGLFFGFGLMAVLAEMFRHTFFKNPTIRCGAIYVIMLYAIFRLSASYDFLTPPTMFSIVYVLLCTKNTVKNSKRYGKIMRF